MMKRWLAAVVCLLVVGSAAAQKERYSQSHRPDPLEYPLVVRVTAARLFKITPPVNVTNGSSSTTSQEFIMTLHLNAVIDGKKIELETGASALLHVGEYRARIVAQDEKKSGWFSRSYDLLFSDGTHVVFTQVGESE
jgi:hypothetical protein